MLYGTNIYYWLNITKLRNYCGTLLAILILMNVFGPVISLMMFCIHFDTHLEECQDHRHHDKDCQASCILEEMMPKQTEALPKKTISHAYFFPDLFFLNRQTVSDVLLKEILITDLFSHYLMLYSPPVLRIHSPPPKLY